MSRRLIFTAAVSAVLAGILAAGALAFTITVRAGNLKGTFGAIPSPKTLPRKKLAPFGVTIHGKIETTDGTHPSALREAIVEDRNVAVDARGVPVCHGGQLEARNTKAAKRACGKAIVGAGSAHAEISFPEQRPITVATPLLLFNGGTKRGTTTIYVHAYITVPAPAAVVTTITVKKVHGGSYAVAKVPVIAGGSGSGVDFRFAIAKKKFTYKHRKHTYLGAKCPTGHFAARLVKAVFKNEAKIAGVAPETVLSGRIAVPCTPRG